MDYLVQRPFRAYLVDPTTQNALEAPMDYHNNIVKWLRNNVPKDASVGIWDAGFIAYHSDRNVVNLDGLVNGKKLLEYLKDGRGVYQYILDEKIDYIGNVFYGPPKPESSIIAPYLTRVYNVGPTPLMIDGKQTYIDWYIWKVNHSGKKD
jgi:hypothetical protein